MPKAQVNGVDLCYDTVGDPAAHPLLLVHGYGAQLIQWPDGFCAALAGRGMFVIRFDNRDVGLSTKFDGVVPRIVPATTPGSYPGLDGPSAYTVRDMALDGIALFRHLGYPRAHVAGASLGGAIVQRMAIDFPDALLSMTSIMARPGPGVGESTAEATAALLTPAPTERDAYAEHMAARARIFQGAFHDPAAARRSAAASYDRCFYPQGRLRQLAAYIADGDRTAGLRSVRTPTMVVHGRDDPLVTPAGGEAVAAAVPGSVLRVFDGMGHDLPEPLWEQIAQAIADHAAKAIGSTM